MFFIMFLNASKLLFLLIIQLIKGFVVIRLYLLEYSYQSIIEFIYLLKFLSNKYFIKFVAQ